VTCYGLQARSDQVSPKVRRFNFVAALGLTFVGRFKDRLFITTPAVLAVCRLLLAAGFNGLILVLLPVESLEGNVDCVLMADLSLGVDFL
jgi:hypothetical protein